MVEAGTFQEVVQPNKGEEPRRTLSVEYVGPDRIPKFLSRDTEPGIKQVASTEERDERMAEFVRASRAREARLALLDPDESMM